MKVSHSDDRRINFIKILCLLLAVFAGLYFFSYLIDIDPVLRAEIGASFGVCSSLFGALITYFTVKHPQPRSSQRVSYVLIFEAAYISPTPNENRGYRLENTKKSKTGQESRKKKEFKLNYRVGLFVSLMFAGLVLLAEALVRLLALNYANEITWYFVVGCAFIIIGLLTAAGLSGDLREFFKE